MWKLEFKADFQKRVKKLHKQQSQALTNAMDNLHAYFKELKNGLKPQQIKRGFVHREPRGVKALDHSGPDKPERLLRLYIYPCEQTDTLFVLTVGNKNTQKRDIKDCSDFVKKYLDSLK